jgi:hypothetical protein
MLRAGTDGTMMTDSASVPTRSMSRPLIVTAAIVGLMFAGALALWAHYGTTVFFEMIVAGIAACF